MEHWEIWTTVAVLFFLIAVPYMRGFIQAWREDRSRIVEWVEGGSVWGGYFICGSLFSPEEAVAFRLAVDVYRLTHDWPPAKSTHFLFSKGKLVEL